MLVPSFIFFLSVWCDFFSSSQKKSACTYQLFGALIIERLRLFLFINQTHCTAIMKADRYTDAIYSICLFASMKLPLGSHVSRVLLLSSWKILAHISEFPVFSVLYLYMKHTVWKNWFTKAHVYPTYLPSLGCHWNSVMQTMIGVGCNSINLFCLNMMIGFVVFLQWNFTFWFNRLIILLKKWGILAKSPSGFFHNFFSSSCYPDSWREKH